MTYSPDAGISPSKQFLWATEYRPAKHSALDSRTQAGPGVPLPKEETTSNISGTHC